MIKFLSISKQLYHQFQSNVVSNLKKPKLFKGFSSFQLKDVRTDYIKEAEELEQLISKVYPLIKNFHLESGDVINSKVVNYISPKTLLNSIDFSIKNEPQDLNSLVQSIKEVLDNSVRTGNPRFFDKLYCGVSPIGYISELLIAATNTNVHTYAVSQILAIIEKICIQELSQAVGYDPKTADGVFVPGGTYGNSMSLILARHQKFPHVRMQGWKEADKPVAFTSSQSHYSIKRAAMVAGVGMNNCVNIKASRNGVMDVKDFEEQIQKSLSEGKTPFYLNATAGTTVMGGFDPFYQLSEICKKYNIWFHVDGCWGGTAIFSSQREKLCKGIELSDSYTFDGHKGLGMPILTTAILTNNKPGLLEKSNSSAADYLFHPHEAQDYDLGEKTLQCGRRADALKVYFHLKRYGWQGLHQRADHAFALSRQMVKIIQQNSDKFELVEHPDWCNVCYWYIPPAFRKHRGNLKSIYPQLGKITQLIYKRMQQQGTMLVNYSPLADYQLPHFFRIILNQEKTKLEDLDFVLAETDRLGQDLTENDLK